VSREPVDVEAIASAAFEAGWDASHRHPFGEVRDAYLAALRRVQPSQADTPQASAQKHVWKASAHHTSGFVCKNCGERVTWPASPRSPICIPAPASADTTTPEEQP
jgi:hypothetical protein